MNEPEDRRRGPEDRSLTDAKTGKRRYGLLTPGDDDLQRVLRLLEEAGLCTEGLQDQLGDAYVLAEDNGNVIGCAGVEAHGAYGLLRSVVVSPEGRGRGIGKALVGNRLEHAKSLGLEAVYLLTTTAAGYFDRFGFRRVERCDVPPDIRQTVEFSRACPETATVMKLELHMGRGAKEGDGMDIKKQVRDKYAEAARRVREHSKDGAPSGRGTCCGGEGTSAQDAITSNLYNERELEGLPGEAVLASLGCGNPTALAELKTGETVLDLGSGGGIDVILSAKRVGPTGKAYGLDMTDEMLAVARDNQRKAGVDNVEFLKGEIENIPLPDGSVDVVVSNCVINLSTDKPRVLREAFRVLRPGGRFAVSDIVARGPIPEDIRRDAELWTGCIAGALEENEYRAHLERAGFERIEIEPTRAFRVGRKGCCGGTQVEVDARPSRAPDPGTFMSAFIRAVKPR
jgi:arsenite methyltransferase